MSVEVLRSKSWNRRARAILRARGCDCQSSTPKRVLRKLGVFGGVNVGDASKSWDVLKILEFLERQVEKTARVLDIGTFGSEIVYSLNRSGFTSVTGIDMNPMLHRAPRSEGISFVTGDFLNPPFACASFAAITAISVLEHGFNLPKLINEVSRLLLPGGYLLATVDYWPEKIDTRGITAFGMDWMIFSEMDLRALVTECGKHGFSPVGRMTYQAGKRTLKWMGKNYTSALIALCFEPLRDRETGKNLEDAFPASKRSHY